jgi:hypothetical protein
MIGGVLVILGVVSRIQLALHTAYDSGLIELTANGWSS